MRKPSVVAVLAALTLMSCTTNPGGDKPDTSTALAAPAAPSFDSTVAVIAFQQEGRIRFANAAGRVWGDVAVKQPAWKWSADSKHLGVLDSSRLHIVNTATGQVASQPCPCRGLSTLGDKFATFTADGAALLLFTPGADAQRLPLARQLESPDLVTGSNNRVIATEPGQDEQSQRDGMSVLSSVDANGAVSPLIEGGSRVSIRSDGGGAMSPDGTKLVTIDAPGREQCHMRPGLLSLVANKVNPAQEPATPAGPEVGRAVLTGPAARMTGLRWAGDDALVTFGPKSGCQQPAASRYLTYAFADGRWQQLTVGALEVGFGAEGRSYAIELPNLLKISDFHEIGSGKLVIINSAGKRTEVGDRVGKLALTPAEEANGEPKPFPQPEPEAVVSVFDTGESLDAHYRDLAKRIADAAESGDVQTLESLCGKCDQQTRKAIATKQGREAIRRTLRTHPTASKNAVTYPGLSTKRCVDGPQQPDSCTTQQIHDVGLLELKPGFNIASGYDDIYRAGVADSVRIEMDGANVYWSGRSLDAEPYRVKNGSVLDKSASYFFTPPQGDYLCGIQADMAGCHGTTRPVPPRPASCGTGPSWGGGMSVDNAGKADFICTGGVLFWPGTNRDAEPRDRLSAGQSVSALGYTCTAGEREMTCVHDTTGHGFRMAPDSNEKF